MLWHHLDDSLCVQGVYAKLVHPSQCPTTKSTGSSKSSLHALVVCTSRSPRQSNLAKSTHPRRSLVDTAPREYEVDGHGLSLQVQSNDLLVDTHTFELSRFASQRRTENRRANANHRQQIRDSVACGVPLVVTFENERIRAHYWVMTKMAYIHYVLCLLVPRCKQGF